MIGKLLVCSLPLLLAACGVARLEPAATAQIAFAGPGPAAFADVTGVRVAAWPGAWQGTPENLETVLTPVLVAVRNDSGRPLLLRYENFALVEPDGAGHTALPPLEINKAVRVSAAAVPDYRPGPGPAVLPYPSPLGLVIVYTRPFGVERPLYDAVFPRLRLLNLPTAEMLAAALPEGILEDGAEISGFLYFEELERRERPISLRVELIDAASGQSMSMVAMPFQVVTG